MLRRTTLARPRAVLVSVATVLISLVAMLLSAADRSVPPADEPATDRLGLELQTVRSAVPERPPAYTPPQRTILTSDPNQDPRGISRALARYVDAVPAGEYVKVETYFLGSSVTYPALVRAFERGVHVQVVLNGSTRHRFPQGTRLATLLGEDRTDDSWVVFTRMSARGPEGVRSIDHNKVWRFSQVGDRRWVTVAGSYNNSDQADSRAYSMMWSLAHRPVYDALEQVFQQSRRDRPVGRNPMREYGGAGWASYVLPSTEQTAAADPVMKRLRRVPAGPGTVIRIAMFTMWDSRGVWIAERLAALARSGARITFVAGPLVGRVVLDLMRWSGVRIEGGCWPDEGTYVHDKAMSLSYVGDGVRRHWTWIGSDNWTTHTMNSDQTVIGLEGRRLYQQFGRHYATLTARPDVSPDLCDLPD